MLITFDIINLAKSDEKLKDKILDFSKTNFLNDNLLESIIENHVENIEEFLKSMDIKILSKYSKIEEYFIINRYYSCLEYFLKLSPRIYIQDYFNYDIKVIEIFYNFGKIYLNSEIYFSLILKCLTEKIMDVLDFLNNNIKEEFDKQLIKIFNERPTDVDFIIANFLVNYCLDIFKNIDDHKIKTTCINTTNLFRCYGIVHKISPLPLMNNIEFIAEIQYEIKFYEWTCTRNFSYFHKLILSSFCDKIEVDIDKFFLEICGSAGYNGENLWVDFAFPKILPRYSIEIQNKIIDKTHGILKWRALAGFVIN